MSIVYRDALGIVSVILDSSLNIAFVDGLVYVTSVDGERLKIKVDDLILITRED